MKTEWTADELMATDFPEQKWALKGIVAEGVTLLFGAPKTGKSWLALNLALSVAQGTKALGDIQCDPGDVLYLALEDPPRRLKTRLSMILGTEPAPSGLTIFTEFQDGTEVDKWLASHPDARLVIVDVLAKVRKPGLSDSTYGLRLTSPRRIHREMTQG